MIKPISTLHISNVNFLANYGSSCSLTLRILTAIFLGYLVAANACSLLSIILPMSRLDATLIATMLSFGIYTAAAMRAFCVQSSGRALLELASLSAGFYGLILLFS